MATIKITKETFETEVMNSELPVLIDFWAEWCGPCKMLSPVLEDFSKEEASVKICKVNVDEEPELAQKFSVMSIPTLVVIKNGKVVNTSVGVKSKESIKQMLV